MLWVKEMDKMEVKNLCSIECWLKDSKEMIPFRSFVFAYKHLIKIPNIICNTYLRVGLYMLLQKAAFYIYLIECNQTLCMNMKL